MSFAVGIILCAIFFAGMNFGQWRMERDARVKRESLERDRILISVPTGKEDAAKTMEFIADFLRKVQESEDNSNPRP